MDVQNNGVVIGVPVTNVSYANEVLIPEESESLYDLCHDYKQVFCRFVCMQITENIGTENDYCSKSSELTYILHDVSGIVKHGRGEREGNGSGMWTPPAQYKSPASTMEAPLQFLSKMGLPTMTSMLNQQLGAASRAHLGIGINDASFNMIAAPNAYNQNQTLDQHQSQSHDSGDDHRTNSQ